LGFAFIKISAEIPLSGQPLFHQKSALVSQRRMASSKRLLLEATKAIVSTLQLRKKSE
jgi:hypothetical protein